MPCWSSSRRIRARSRRRKRGGYEACSTQRKTVDERRRRTTAFAGDIRNECVGHSSGAWTHCSRGALPSREIWPFAKAGNGSAVPPPGRAGTESESQMIKPKRTAAEQVEDE